MQLLEVPTRTTGVLLVNSGSAAVTVDTTQVFDTGFTLEPGSSVTLPSSASLHYCTRVHAVADGDGGELTCYLPEW
jgi:hypothetical protein